MKKVRIYEKYENICEKYDSIRIDHADRLIVVMYRDLEVHSIPSEHAGTQHSSYDQVRRVLSWAPLGDANRGTQMTDSLDFPQAA